MSYWYKDEWNIDLFSRAQRLQWEMVWRECPVRQNNLGVVNMGIVLSIFISFNYYSYLMSWVSLLHFIERKMRFKEINLSEVAKISSLALSILLFYNDPNAYLTDKGVSFKTWHYLLSVLISGLCLTLIQSEPQSPNLNLLYIEDCSFF